MKENKSADRHDFEELYVRKRERESANIPLILLSRLLFPLVRIKIEIGENI